MEPFYRRDGDAFVATPSTRGPWSHGHQHGGPPAALLLHVLDARLPRPDLRVARFTVELLRPVPIGRLEVTAEEVRPGRKIQLVRAAMTHDGTEVALATAWRIRHAHVPMGVGADGDPLPAGPEDGEERTFFAGRAERGWHTAMEIRFTEGAFTERGPATAWFAARVPLVDDTEPSPAERVALAADAGNGISSRFDGVFVNPDLSVHLARLPQGRWVGLQAATQLTDDGIGVASSALYDEHGPLGRGAQSLYLEA